MKMNKIYSAVVNFKNYRKTSRISKLRPPLDIKSLKKHPKTLMYKKAIDLMLKVQLIRVFAKAAPENIKYPFFQYGMSY